VRFDCYHCGERIRVPDDDEQDWIECPHCEPSAPVATTSLQRRDKRRPFEVQPIVLPVILPSKNESALDDETAIDLREKRRHRNEDRAGNPIGIAGFALVATTLLFLLGAMILHKPLPAYLWVVAVLSVPASLLGLVFSIVGSLLVGRPKLFSLLGVGAGGFLILVGIPISFLLLKGI
jgi:hypothetical protein